MVNPVNWYDYQRSTVHDDLEEVTIEFEPLDEDVVNDANSTESDDE